MTSSLESDLATLKRLRKLGIRMNADDRPADAIAAWTEMMRFQRKAAGGVGAVRYLRADWWTNGIGHIGLIGFFAKRRLLGLHESNYVIVTRPDMIANRFYLDLWSKYFEITEAAPADMPLFEDFPMVLDVRGEWMLLEFAVDQINREWRPRGPLLWLSGGQIERGWHHLAGLGVKNWFVGLHVRQGGLGEFDHLSVRNVADIATYAKAIARINAAGGAVIRVGAKLPVSVPGLIDLGGAPDWLDIFVMSQCRFFIGNNSGPSVVASTFGVPLLICNFAPRGALFPYPAHKLRKHLRNGAGHDIDDGHPANLQWSKQRLAEAGIHCIDNTEDEIDVAVAEMMIF